MHVTNFNYKIYVNLSSRVALVSNNINKLTFNYVLVKYFDHYTMDKAIDYVVYDYHRSRCSHLDDYM